MINLYFGKYYILLIGFLILVILFLALFDCLFSIISSFRNKDKVNENTRFCFDCDIYFDSPKDSNMLYCPYCGKKTYGFDEESLKRFDNDYPEGIEKNIDELREVFFDEYE